MSLPPIHHTVTERFLRYVKIDTQSDPDSVSNPSTEKQKELGKLLAEELLSMGVKDAALDEYGYVYATLPATTEKKVPVICFCSHLDTSPDCSGKDVHPVIHKNYNGQDIVLPGDTSQIIRVSEHPALLHQNGNDIITSDGTTLLGADNKAGVAEIMDTVNYLIAHPEIKHGTIKILFTPDEEVGRGVEKVDLKHLGADYAYTVDGEEAGALENETFSADEVTIVVHGFSIHPGFAKGRMENALKIAAEIIEQLPKNKLSPETTAGKEGFMHPTGISGGIEKTTIKFIIRDFAETGLKEIEALLKNITEQVVGKYKKASFEFTVKEQYRNMKKVLQQHPFVTEYALEAIKRSGLTPHLSSVRGGTDGSRLSFMGLPCPNIFAGEHAFHSKQEWVSLQDMQKAVETLIHLAMIWEEKSYN